MQDFSTKELSLHFLGNVQLSSSAMWKVSRVDPINYPMTSMWQLVAFWKLKGGEELLTLFNFLCFSIKQIQFVATQSLTDNTSGNCVMLWESRNPGVKCTCATLFIVTGHTFFIHHASTLARSRDPRAAQHPPRKGDYWCPPRPPLCCQAKQMMPM